MGGAQLPARGVVPPGGTGHNRLTERRATTESKTDGRGGSKLPVYVSTPVGGSGWNLEFESWQFSHDIAKAIFVGGVVPPEFTLVPQSTADGQLSRRWKLTWSGTLSQHARKLTPFGQELRVRAAGAGDATPLEAAQRAQEEAAAREARAKARVQSNATFLPALGMTAADALRTLQPGAYVAVEGRAIPLPPIALGEVFPGNVKWLSQYGKTGWFVWLGYDANELTMQMTPISEVRAFQNDISWYLRQGAKLYDAEKSFTKQWDDIVLKFLITFALVLTAAPTPGKRLDTDDVGFNSSLSNVERSLQNPERVKGSDMKNASFLGAVDKTAALQTGVMAYQTISIVKSVAESLGKSDDDVELQALSNAITEELIRRMEAYPKQAPTKDLRTGNLGEAVAREILERRGYVVIEIQNASGHGIDLFAIKVKGKNRGLMVYIESKASSKDYAWRFSVAQKDRDNFIKSRLQRVIDAQGHWAKVPLELRQIAALALEEIKAGRPIGGIKFGFHWLTGSFYFKVEVDHWKPATAKLVTPQQKAGSVVTPVNPPKK